MKFFMLIPYYITWHYTFALGEFISAFSNFLWFLSNYFSISTLFRSLFKPIRKWNEKRLTDFSKKEIKIVTFINSIFSTVIRITVIIGGVCAWILSIILGLFLFFLWLILPIVILVALIASIIVLIK
jgi:hypothetical protein